MTDNILEDDSEEFRKALAIDISNECLQVIRQIKLNQPVVINQFFNQQVTNQFLLQPYDAVKFTGRAWKLLGQYIANNTHLVEIDLDCCSITDETMSSLFGELERSSSLQRLLLSDNEFSIDGVRSMIPFLQNSPNLSKLFMGSIFKINTACFEMLISALDGKSIEVLNFSGCNIGDISALSTYNLPCLHTLKLNENNIGREGIISISNLLQREDTVLTQLFLQNTGN